jgi:hypothetical protein
MLKKSSIFTIIWLVISHLSVTQIDAILLIFVKINPFFLRKGRGFNLN